jgi:alpha-glucosidase (family GH31 glycosyl hydrolase)
MGDHAAFGPGRTDLVLEDFVRDPLGINNGADRMISNFVICPQQGFATVNMEPATKVIRITDTENAQGSKGVRAMPAMYYFVGTPQEIYQSYLDKRNMEGYPVYKPKPEWFGVGWEAFGALAWMTNQKTVTENVDQYLESGYPLRWMVVGSGFWPRGPGEFDEHGTPYGSETASEEAKKLQATTSFGMWDETLYPDPKGMINHFHDRGLIFTLGLRIGFIPGGPFTGEGVEKGYFIKNEQGVANLYEIGYPRVPIHLLDTEKADAVAWYVQLCGKWADYGVDGYKEDLFGWPQDLPDDLIDPVNRALMDQGVYIMGRNNYLGSPADIHRYNDFNYNQMQDRGPINGLAYAFSGFPYVYPDIVGGTGMATGRFGEESRDKLRTYLIRYAQYAALNPSMAFGYGPWNFDEETNALCLRAAQLHERLLPHIYSNAIHAYHTGFPYTMIPLPLAYPDDPHVYGLADTVHRSYEWLIGESLLAAPLYGDDYARAFSRDIYLPAGKWMDYDDGTIYAGGQTLEDFPIPIDKTPLFVGGTGFVVEQEDGKLLGRLYPINAQSETVFWHTDGETQSTISVDVRNWDDLTVTDLEQGGAVAVENVRHAWQFVLEPGSDYRIQ